MESNQTNQPLIFLNRESSGITDYFTLLIAKENTEISVQDKKYQMYTDDLIVCRENMHYSAKSGAIFSINVKRELLDSLFFSQIADCYIFYQFFQEENVKDEHLFFYLPDTDDVHYFIKLLEYSLSHPINYPEKMYRLLLVGLITCLDHCHHEHLVVQNSTMISDNRFGKLLKYMGENYATCSLAAVAEKFGYNSDYLSVRFKMITGVTFSQKLLDIRLTEAANILISSNLKIDTVALNVGFSDKSWFIKKFHERFGVTPSVYRKNMRKSLNIHVR